MSLRVVRLPPRRETTILHQQPIAAPQQCLASRIAEPKCHCGAYSEHGRLNPREDGFETVNLAPLLVQALKQGDTPIQM